jgi:hypothetical protein
MCRPWDFCQETIPFQHDTNDSAAVQSRMRLTLKAINDELAKRAYAVCLAKGGSGSV